MKLPKQIRIEDQVRTEKPGSTEHTIATQRKIPMCDVLHWNEESEMAISTKFRSIYTLPFITSHLNACKWVARACHCSFHSNTAFCILHLRFKWAWNYLKSSIQIESNLFQLQNACWWWWWWWCVTADERDFHLKLGCLFRVLMQLLLLVGILIAHNAIIIQFSF